MRKTQGCGWLAIRGDVLEKHLQARLRVPFQNISGIRATNQSWVFRGNKLVASSSVYIREIRGFHSVAQACLGGDLQKMPHHSCSQCRRDFPALFVLFREI